MKLMRKKIKKWLYGSCPGFAGSFPYFGTRVYFPKDSIVFQVACDQGIYESDNTFLLCSLVEPESVYFDIGANIGLMAIPVLQKNNSCRVVSFEPSPNTLSFLTRTAERSSFRDKWKILGKAVGREVGVLDFFAASARMGAFDGFQDTQRAGATQKITVPVTTVDLEWEAMGSPRVSVIKIDIEGAELEALYGAIHCLQHEQPYILLEWNSTNLKAYNCSPESLLDFADKVNYQLYSLPHAVPISDAVSLRVNMVRTESFLLAPLNKKPRYCCE